MDSIPGEYEALGLVVFSNIILFITIFSYIAFRIILSTWLYNYY